MDRYRYFIFNQKSMVVLGLLQIACAAVCLITGVIDGAHRRESALSKSRTPIWAGVFMSIPGIMALFSSQRKNPILVFVLDKLVEGANITLLVTSIFSGCIVLIIAYLSCRSLPCCACYDSVTGFEWLQSNEDQLQTSELVCISSGQMDSIFNSPVKLQDVNVEPDDEETKPPPYIRMT
uniref:Uncharacterized protein isoform X2 n=1 Tax=Pogona vitticeps TaxID=103695 RepID=A0A6J0SY81_9SAUR